MGGGVALYETLGDEGREDRGMQGSYEGEGMLLGSLWGELSVRQRGCSNRGMQGYEGREGMLLGSLWGELKCGRETTENREKFNIETLAGVEAYS